MAGQTEAGFKAWTRLEFLNGVQTSTIAGVDAELASVRANHAAGDFDTFKDNGGAAALHLADLMDVSKAGAYWKALYT